MSHILADAIALSIATGPFSAASAQSVQPDNGSPPPKDRPTVSAGDRQPDRSSQDRPIGQPLPGQSALGLSLHWSLRPGLRYLSLSQIPIDTLSASIYGLRERTFSLEPPAPHYWVDDSLMGIVYKSGQMSRRLRNSFERQMTRNGLKSSPCGQRACDRVRRMDESISRLRSQTGRVSQSAAREPVGDVLEAARQVANSLNNHANLRQLVRREWENLQSELNELACYYGEPGIR